MIGMTTMRNRAGAALRAAIDRDGTRMERELTNLTRRELEELAQCAFTLTMAASRKASDKLVAE